MKAGIKVTAGLLVATAISGCVASSLVKPTPGVEQISFQPEPPPFCGPCETVNLVATADGKIFIERGHWAGHYHNWKLRRETRQITPGEFAEFKRRLEPYRPFGTTNMIDGHCTDYITDNGGAIVRWTNGEDHQTRVFDFGCLDDRAMNDTVQNAPSAFGL